MYIKCERREQSKTSFLQDNKHCQIWHPFLRLNTSLPSIPQKIRKNHKWNLEMSTYICQPYFKNRSEHVEKLGQKCKILALLGQ